LDDFATVSDGILQLVHPQNLPKIFRGKLWALVISNVNVSNSLSLHTSLCFSPFLPPQATFTWTRVWVQVCVFVHGSSGEFTVTCTST